jgi:hypothetical protein
VSEVDARRCTNLLILPLFLGPDQRIRRSLADTLSKGFLDMHHGHERDDGSGAIGTNLVYSKFLFVTLRRDDDKALARIREAGTCIARGFFNDFHGNGTPTTQSHETIQFLEASTPGLCRDGLLSARYVAHLTTKYRPRLDEIQAELERRLGDVGSVRSVDGAVQAPRYTSAALHEFAYKQAAGRRSGHENANVIIIPMSKTAAWWEMSTLERHAYFYPHVNPHSGAPASGHAMAAEHGIQTLYRRLYHNPDGYQRPDEYDFITYVECADEHLPTFDIVRQALRDETRNPEWRFVIEGPEWRGRRVTHW